MRTASIVSSHSTFITLSTPEKHSDNELSHVEPNFVALVMGKFQQKHAHLFEQTTGTESKSSSDICTKQAMM